MANKKEDWEITWEKKDAQRFKGMKNLTPDQLEALDEFYYIVGDILQEFYDGFDCSLGSLRKLDSERWKLFHEFRYESRESL